MDIEVQEGLKTAAFSLLAFGAGLLIASLLYWNWRILRIVKRIETITEDVSEQERLRQL